MSVGWGELELYSFIVYLVCIFRRPFLVYYTSVVIVLDYAHRETILPLNPALKSLYGFKDYSSIFTWERKPIDLPAIFVFDW
jgi:hypothetical protein